MSTALWIVAGFLTALYLLSGFGKVFGSREKLAGMTPAASWALSAWCCPPCSTSRRSWCRSPLSAWRWS